MTLRTALLGLLFALLVAGIALHDGMRPQRPILANFGKNVSVLYCSGAAIAAGNNPYAVDAVRRCALRTDPDSHLRAASIYPSRLPGYALAAFALLSRLPFVVAKAIWLALLLAAVFAAAGYLAAITGVRAPLVLLALSLSAAYLSMTDGILAPIVLLGLSAAAYYLERRRFVLAAFALALTMVEPQIGIVACVSGAIWVPRLREPLAVAVAALVVAGVSLLGFTRSVGYVMHVVPGRVLAELAAVDQWSLSHVLHLLGVPDSVAVWLGIASYVLMAALGIAVAGRAAGALRSAGLIVALPAAAVLLGGTDLHEQQLCIAFPAAFLLASRAQRGRSVAWLALGLLVFPWFALSDARAAVFLPAFAVALTAVAGLTYVAAGGLSALSRCLTVGGALVGCGVLVLLFRHLPGPAAPAVARPVPPPAARTAVSDWGAFLRANPELSVASWQKEAEKMPSRIALVSLIAIAGLQSRRAKRDVRADRNAWPGLPISA